MRPGFWAYGAPGGVHPLPHREDDGRLGRPGEPRIASPARRANPPGRPLLRKRSSGAVRGRRGAPGRLKGGGLRPSGSSHCSSPRVSSGLTGKPAHADTLSAWTEPTPRPPGLPRTSCSFATSLRCADGGDHKGGGGRGDIFRLGEVRTDARPSTSVGSRPNHRAPLPLEGPLRGRWTGRETGTGGVLPRSTARPPPVVPSGRHPCRSSIALTAFSAQIAPPARFAG